MSTEFTQLNHGWNADPNVPRESIQVVGHDLALEFFANPYQFKEFKRGQKLRIRFSNATQFRLGRPNDEGWYMGQCRFSKLAPSWGEFYEVSGDLRLDVVRDERTPVQAPTGRTKHFLFYLRESTFECDAESWSLEYI